MLTFSCKIINQLLLFISFVLPFSLHADVVKPALIEINVNQLGQIEVEARVSIEALLTGINSQYKNTQEAPNAAEYDVLRKMQSDELEDKFLEFQKLFLNQISLKRHTSKNSIGEEIPLKVSDVKIPEPGYTKVPRISLIKLKSEIALDQVAISWYYPMAFGDNAVRLRQIDDKNKKYHWSEWQWLRKDKPSKPFSLTEVVAKRPLIQVVSDYIVLGFQHIIPKGLDHIVFILGLFFFSVVIKTLFWQITMFTLAHSITLGLSMNGIINLPSNIVEPLIAVSIIYIGIENIFSKNLKNSRLLLVFIFGLLHGLGFASVLADFGLPDNDFILALISFNIGVELGQLAILLIAFLLIGIWFKNKSWYRASITIPASLMISTVGIYWFIQRLDLNF
ncbi:MAG: hydrogenase/urease accessory protein HupE [Cocleimonas sp.]|jgi:hydrogenase/urease accessory protein HupE